MADATAVLRRFTNPLVPLSCFDTIQINPLI
jgi:hypothetical protein